MKVYNLSYKDKQVKGAFFNDPNFGFYFISEVLTKKLLRDETVLISLDSDIVYANSNGDYNSRVHRVNKEDSSYVYIFALLDTTLLNSVEATTLDELANVNDFIFSGDDVISYLADLSALPNGNYLVGNVQDYITAIEDIQKSQNDKEIFYRGHYSYKFDLVPSLFRKKKYFDNEQAMYMDFKTQFYNELSNKKYIEILTTMQHYKMPTRLLDTTSNPLVALFMAIDKPTGFKTKNYNVGEVVIMAEDRKKVKYSDSNSITIISSLAVLESKYKTELYNKIVEAINKNDPSIYKNTLSYKRFVAEIVSSLPSFNEEFFEPETLLNPVHVRVGMINERIIAQSGNFILFGLTNINDSSSKVNTLVNNRVFVVNQEHIKVQLSMLNINSATMYPDKDHMSVTITKMYD